jgi:hypothetical protein
MGGLENMCKDRRSTTPANGNGSSAIASERHHQKIHESVKIPNEQKMLQRNGS